MPEEPIFSLKSISCTRANRLLFQNFSLELRAGEILRLAGANGTGKTSLLRVMSNLLPIQSGKIVSEKEASVVFMPAEDSSLKVQETAFENLSFWSEVWRGGDVHTALAKVNLLDIKDRPVKYFSAGQKRRLSIARMTLKKARLWLLDEPLNGLDPAAQENFLFLIGDHVKSGGAVVIAGHQDVPGARIVQL